MNPDTKQFCADCGTRLPLREAVSVSVTKTLVSPAAEGSYVAGRYRLLGKLGEGGMGVVYKAEDTRLKRTVAYMSPEQAQGQSADHRTDIWSLGVVLYEMLSGQLPFKGERDQAVVYSILNEEPNPITQLRSEIPMTLEQVIGKALEKRLDCRYQHIAEFTDDLRSIAEGLEPEGIKARPRKARLLKRKKAILYAGIGVFAIVITAGVLILFTGRSELIDSIAVLPLENMTGDSSQEYFVDGMTEALIANLAKIGSLRVISRTSIMQYKQARKSLPEIAKELNVKAVVEGSVARSDGRVRITAQLVDASKDRHIWADTFDRDSHDILALQREISAAIAREVQVKLTPQEEEHLAIMTS